VLSARRPAIHDGASISHTPATSPEARKAGEPAPSSRTGPECYQDGCAPSDEQKSTRRTHQSCLSLACLRTGRRCSALSSNSRRSASNTPKFARSARHRDRHPPRSQERSTDATPGRCGQPLAPAGVDHRIWMQSAHLLEQRRPSVTHDPSQTPKPRHRQNPTYDTTAPACPIPACRPPRTQGAPPRERRNVDRLTDVPSAATEHRFPVGSASQ
jgi:hypothetical protein